MKSSFFPVTIRFVRLKALKTEKGKSSYPCNYGLCWPRSSILFSLSNFVLPNKTDFWPTREGLWGWTRYEEWIYICVRKLPAGGRSTLRAQWSGGWFRFDKGRMSGRKSSTVGLRRVRFGSRARTIGDAPSLLLCTLTFTWRIHPIEPTLKGGPQAWGSTKHKVSTLINFLGLVVKERDRHSFVLS